ncbi:carbonic anhydrase [bacterium]|nr:carbonic anhydrase [bacterium]
MSEPKPTLNLNDMHDLAVARMFAGNQAFAERIAQEDPEFFARQARQQEPHTLWIGCSDSRVSSDVITNTDPGNLFVHRNVANLVVHTDFNVLSAIDYAVNHLHVQHIVVCGHYQCGGVLAAMQATEMGLIDNWLRNIKDVYRLHSAELEALPDQPARARRLVELNVFEQVYNVCKTSTVQKSWREHGRPFVHGWVYDLETGLIKDLEVNVSGRRDLEEIYRFDMDKALHHD